MKINLKIYLPDGRCGANRAGTFAEIPQGAGSEVGYAGYSSAEPRLCRRLPGGATLATVPEG